MTSVRLTTAGESHGPSEVCILEGVPAGLAVTAEHIDAQLVRRQAGYGRGGRMAIERDRCEIVAGIRLGATIGSPIALLVRNRDHENWLESMAVAPVEDRTGSVDSSTTPRPGHADYAGLLKYGHADIRPVLERASARETVARVAGGAVCRRLLEELGVTVRARVVSIGAVGLDVRETDYAHPERVDWEAVEASPVAVEDTDIEDAMCKAVDLAREAGESLGGIFEVWAWGVPPGLGNNTSMDRRLDARLLGAMGSIPAIKGVEFGCAFRDAELPGSQVHDAFTIHKTSGGNMVTRSSNRAGGVEGGITNGMPLVVRAAMKPIPTLTKPLPSVDLATMKKTTAYVERSDVMAVPAARVVGEAMMCLTLADAYLEKFGGDAVAELTQRVDDYVGRLEEQGTWHHF